MWRTRRAFTLLELVVALAVAAVVAGFALPAWRGQIARGYRIDVVAALYRAAQFVDTQASGAPSLPAGLDQAPPSGVPVYRLRLLAADDTNGGYAIEATPGEDGPMRDDPCGTFMLDATGLRSNRPPGAAAVPGTHECWKDR